MKKSLSLFVASSMVVSMFAGAAYAADAKNPGEYLNELGVIQGNGTDLKEDQSWKRQDVIVLLSRLLGEEDEAQDAETTHEFTDVTNSFYDGFISWAVEEGLVEGKGNGKFGFNAELKNQEFYAIVLRAFGHETTGEGYAEVPELAVKYGFATEDTDFDAIPTRGETYATIVKALETEVPGTGKTLGVILGLIEEEAPQAAAVEKVTGLNATQVAVQFTAAVDKTAAETAGNYTINNVSPASVSLSEDGLTATLTYASAASVEVTNAVLVVSPVATKADTDKTTPKYTQIFTFEDTVKPEFVSVEAKTNNTVATSVTVKASEPIQAASVKINGSYYSANFNGTDTATITGVSLEVNKTHTIELVNLTDKSTNINVLASKTFSVVVDTVAPTATLSASSDKTILVTFSKPMDNATVLAGLTNAVKNEILAGVVTNSPVAVSGSNNTKYEIVVNETLYANSATRTLNVAFPGSIKDSLGNSIVAGTQAVVLSKDVAKPAPTGYKVVKNSSGNITAIEVNFSEALAANPNPGEPTIVNSNGVSVTTTLLNGFTAQAINAGDKKVVFNATTPGGANGQFAFSFPAGLVTDRSETANTSDAFNYTIDLGAGSTTFSLPANPISVVGKVVTVEFGTAVKGGAVANSATDLNNYTIAGKPLPAGTTITLDSAQDTATITLPDGSIDKTDPTAIVTVANILSLNGAALNSYVGTIPVTDNTKAKLSSAVLNADGTVTIGFDEALAVDPIASDLVVTLNGSALATGEYTVNKILAGADAGKYLIQVATTVDAGADATPATADDRLFVDLDGDGAYDAGEIVVTTGASVTAGTANLTNAVFSSVKVKTTSGVSNAQDAAGNKLEVNVEKVVK